MNVYLFVIAFIALYGSVVEPQPWDGFRPNNVIGEDRCGNIGCAEPRCQPGQVAVRNPGQCCRTCAYVDDRSSGTGQLATSQTCPSPSRYPNHCFTFCGPHLPCFGSQLCCSNGCGKECMTSVGSSGTGSVATAQASAPTRCIYRGRYFNEGDIVACNMYGFYEMCRSGSIRQTSSRCNPWG